jgi:hypothetical protein
MVRYYRSWRVTDLPANLKVSSQNQNFACQIENLPGHLKIVAKPRSSLGENLPVD